MEEWQTKPVSYTENTHKKGNTRQGETDKMQRGMAGQNSSERGRKVGRARAQEEKTERGLKKKIHGRSLHSQNSPAGVDLMHLHSEDAETVG